MHIQEREEEEGGGGPLLSRLSGPPRDDPLSNKRRRLVPVQDDGEPHYYTIYSRIYIFINTCDTHQQTPRL